MDLSNYILLDTGVYLAPEYPMLNPNMFQVWFEMDNHINYGICNSFHQVLDLYKEFDPSLHILILTKCTLKEFGVSWGRILAVTNDESFHYHIFKQISTVSL